MVRAKSLRMCMCMCLCSCACVHVYVDIYVHVCIHDNLQSSIIVNWFCPSHLSLFLLAVSVPVSVSVYESLCVSITVPVSVCVSVCGVDLPMEILFKKQKP